VKVAGQAVLLLLNLNTPRLENGGSVRNWSAFASAAARPSTSSRPTTVSRSSANRPAYTSRVIAALACPHHPLHNLYRGTRGYGEGRCRVPQFVRCEAQQSDRFRRTVEIESPEHCVPQVAAAGSWKTRARPVVVRRAQRRDAPPGMLAEEPPVAGGISAYPPPTARPHRSRLGGSGHAVAPGQYPRSEAPSAHRTADPRIPSSVRHTRKDHTRWRAHVLADGAETASQPLPPLVDEPRRACGDGATPVARRCTRR